MRPRHYAALAATAAAGVLAGCGAGAGPVSLRSSDGASEPHRSRHVASAPMRYDRGMGQLPQSTGGPRRPARDPSRNRDRPALRHAEQRQPGKSRPARDPRAIARRMVVEYGWSEYEFSCLNSLWIGESNWDPYAENPTSGAYGIPQSLPAEKMASAGSDWRTNPATQIAWGLEYIRVSYGTPCSANSFKLANGWY
ncbi:MAG: lytic transglycosylase domain-containing protein [Nocardioidaceae bacterium]